MFITSILSKLSQPSISNVDYEALLQTIPMGQSIEHNIVQTCKSTSELPTELVRNTECIQRLNPDWNCRIYDNAMVADYICKYYGEKVFAYYNRISPEYGAARADFFRYLYIYREGGCYLDIKSSIEKPLSANLKSDDLFILSFWDNLEGEPHFGVGHYFNYGDEFPRGEIPQWYIISTKGHPFIRRTIIQVMKNIDNYNPYTCGVGWMGTVYTTGPVPYSRTIYENIQEASYRLVNIFSDFGFRYSIYEGLNPDSTFHAKAIKSDYRKNIVPLIVHDNSVIQNLNKGYLKIMIGLKHN